MWVEHKNRPRRNPEILLRNAVSFDVFDTFLLRRCTAPDGVFELACRFAGVDTSRPGAVESFVQHRRLAESRARKASKSRTGYSEVPIEQIYAQFPRRMFGLDALSAADLAEAEFRAELELCFADTDIAQLYESARAEGKSTGFVSDTYWGGERLGRLLRHCRPGLAWDFLYASCDHGTGKSEKLFEVVLAKEKLSPARVMHIGDNPVADVQVPQRFGLETRHHPQASDYFGGVLRREMSAFSLFASAAATGSRLDGGLSALRRVVARTLPNPTDGFALGATVLGPLMVGFVRFVADRIAKLEQQPGRKVAVAFLARDGFLPYRLWSHLDSRPVGYAEINRRTATLAAADGPSGLGPPFDPIRSIDHETTVAILGVDTPALQGFFRQMPNGVATGTKLAEKLPSLIGRKAIADLAGSLRTGLVEHLRHVVPGFDDCTDLVLVDLGYSGSVQKGLQRTLTLAGKKPRLHGLYLLTKDEEVDDLGGDTAEGLISDLVVSPQAKYALLSNIAVLEQICCAQVGSVRHYRDGKPIREKDQRDPAQVQLSAAAQAGALQFARLAAERIAAGVDPYLDLDATASWAAALLGRLLLLPTDDELLLLGTARHDVNLGSRAVVALADPAKAAAWALAKSVGESCVMPPPPMWPAGSLTALSPSGGFLAALRSTGHFSMEVFGDIPCGKVDVTLIDRQAMTSSQVSCLRTGHGDIRIHVPIPAACKLEAVAVAIGQLAPEGVLRGVVLQQGASAKDAMDSFDVMRLGADRLNGMKLELTGSHFQATANGKLLILLPPLTKPVAVVTVVVSPLGGNRVLALAEDAGTDAPLAPLALGLPASVDDNGGLPAAPRPHAAGS